MTARNHRDLAQSHGLLGFAPDGRLELSGEPIDAWSRQLGGPGVLVLGQRAGDNTRWYRETFARQWPEVRVHYALKASYDRDLCRAIVAQGAGLEVMSARELALSVELGVPGADLVINGVGRSAAFTRDAVRARPRLLVVDSDADLGAAVQVSRSERRPVPVALRLAGDGVQSRLGLRYPDELLPALDVVLQEPFLVAAGLLHHSLHSEVGVEAVRQHVRDLVEVCLALRTDRGLSLQYVDIGGGLAGRLEVEAAGGLDPIATVVAAELDRLPYRPELICEPGRVLVADAALGVGRIVATKRRDRVVWGICDVATNFLVPVPGSEFLPTAAYWPAGAAVERFRLGDQSCSEATLSESVEMPADTAEVVFLQAGAYTQVFAHEWGPDAPRIIPVN